MGDNIAFINVGDGLTVTSVACSETWTSAILSNGQIKSVGTNLLGDPMPGETAMPAGVTAVEISCGSVACCARLSNSSVQCWGTPVGATETNLGEDDIATSVSCGSDFCCAVLESGQPKCWGANGLGQLGLSAEIAATLTAVGAGVKVTSLSCGNIFTCALLSTGQLMCWGYNANGQLGIGDGTNNLVAGQNLTLTALGAGVVAKAVSCGFDHTCILSDHGRIKCWGNNNMGQLGLGHKNALGSVAGQMGDDLNFVNLGVGVTATAVSCGHQHTCALLSNGEIKCWGHMEFGRLGLGIINDWLGLAAPSIGDLGNDLAAVDLGEVETTSVAAGAEHACVISSDGKLKCFGDNTFGQLGRGNTANQGDGAGEMGDALRFVHLGNVTVKAVSCGTSHTCALLSDGTLKCFGQNAKGQLGQGDTVSRGIKKSTPVDLGTGFKAIKISSGYGRKFNCAVSEAGGLKCWGANQNNQLGPLATDQPGVGDGWKVYEPITESEMGDNIAFINVGDGLTVTSVACSETWTSAILSNGQIKSVGTNLLGDPMPGETAMPAGVTAVEISCGSVACCARLSNSSVQCWGTPVGATETNLGEDDIATSVSCGSDFCCAVLESGQPKCWGANGLGQLGLSAEIAATLTAVGAGVKVTSLSCGNIFTCALLSTGQLMCWGYNANGQLGIGDGTNNLVAGQNLTLTALGAGVVAKAVSCGFDHTCILSDHGRIKCWGNNNMGQLGLGHKNALGSVAGQMGDDLNFVNLGVGVTATAVSCGHQHTCALLSNGEIKCWGHMEFGRLGLGIINDWLGLAAPSIGDLGNDLAAVDLGNLGTGVTVQAVSCGTSHTCALLSDGKLKCWGNNDVGQLGIGNTDDQGDGSGEMGNSLPFVDVPQATSISCGHSHTCAELASGQFKCWGLNADGQLGIGDVETRGDAADELGDNLPAVDFEALECFHTNGSAMEAGKWPGSTLKKACRGACIEMQRWDSNGVGHAAGLCNDDLTFDTSTSVENIAVCEDGGDKGVLKHGGEWWVYGCCGGKASIASAWTPPSAWMPCGKGPDCSDLAICAKRYPFVRSWKAHHKPQGQVGVELAFSGTVVSGKTITIFGLVGATTPDSNQTQIAQAGDQLEDLGTWTQDNATLVVRTRRDVYNNETFTVRWTVKLGANETQTLSVKCDNCADDVSVNTLCQQYAWASTDSLRNPVVFSTEKEFKAGAAQWERYFAVDVSTLFPGLGSLEMVQLPRNALGSTMSLSVKIAAFDPAAFKIKSAKSYYPVGGVVTMGPAGTHFASAITLLLPVDASMVARGQFIGAFYNETLDSWVELPTLGTKNVSGHIFLEVQTTHFAEFVSMTASNSDPNPATTTPSNPPATTTSTDPNPTTNPATVVPTTTPAASNPPATTTPPTSNWDCSSATRSTVSWSAAFCVASFSSEQAACGVTLNAAGSAGASEGSLVLGKAANLTAEGCVKMRAADPLTVSLSSPAWSQVRMVARSDIVATMHEIELSGGMQVRYTGGEIVLPTLQLPGARRAIVPNCPLDVTVRIARVGQPLASACSCPAMCGPTAECDVSVSGLWTTVMVPADVCDAAVASEEWKVSLTAILLPAILLPIMLPLLCYLAYRYHQAQSSAKDATKAPSPYLSVHVSGEVGEIGPITPPAKNNESALPPVPPSMAVEQRMPPGLQSMAYQAPHVAFPEQAPYMAETAQMADLPPLPAAFFASPSRGQFANELGLEGQA